MKVGNVFLVIIAARYLGVENFGQFSFIVSFSTLFQTITDMGINFYSIREVARNKKVAPEFLGHAITTKLFLSIVAVVILNLVIHFFDHSPQEIIGFRIASIILVMDTYLQQFYAVFRGHQKMEYESFALLIETSLIVGLGISVLLLGKSYLFLLGVYAFAKFVNLIFSGTLCNKKITPIHFLFSFQYNKNLVLKSLPFALHILFGLVAFRLDVIFLRMLKGAYVVGLYRVTLSITFTVVLFAHMYQAAVYPVLSKLYMESIERLKRTIERSFSLLFFVGLLFAVIIYRYSDFIILLVFGEKYRASGAILKILILMLPLKFVDQILGITLDSINRQKVRPYLGLALIAINSIFCFIFITYFSAKGAAFAMVLTELASFVLYYYFVARYLFAVPIAKPIVKGILAAAGAYYVMILAKSLNFFFVATIGFIVYIGILLFLKADDNLGVRAIILKSLKDISLVKFPKKGTTL